MVGNHEILARRWGEYAWVADDVYRRERARVLERFLERPYLYLTEAFRHSHESRARRNAQREIAALTGA